MEELTCESNRSYCDEDMVTLKIGDLSINLTATNDHLVNGIYSDEFMSRPPDKENEIEYWHYKPHKEFRRPAIITKDNYDQFTFNKQNQV